MSWDRVIQDSDDEDDPLVEDDFPTSVAPRQGHHLTFGNSALASRADCGPVGEHTPLQTVNVEPQLSINFDDFLQPQNMARPGLSASQQRREERWIPSTSGNGGSIGAMMTEIGLAQRRLLDDVSSVEQATATPSTELTHPASPPSIATDEPDTHGGLNGDGVVHTRATPHRSKSLQTAPYSPHDTEPLSSSTSSRLNRSKSHNPPAGLVSRQRSRTGAHDELSLPAVSVEIPTTKKKRGHPKKEPMPEDDEDDELSNTRDHEFLDQAPVEKQRRDQLGNGSNGTLVDSTEAFQNGAVTTSSTVEIPESVNSLCADGASREKIRASASDHHSVVSEQPAARKPQKKKLKRGKTTSAVVKKTYDSDVEDDVIWVESRPVHVEAVDKLDSTPAQKTASTKPSDSATVIPKHSEALESTHAATTGDGPYSSNNTMTETNGPPVAKKRGRKRKTTTESTTTESASEPIANRPPPESETRTSICTVETNIEPAPGAATGEPEENTNKQSADPIPQPALMAQPEGNTTEPPQTPQRPQQANTAAQQDPDKTAVCGRDAHKGPDRHSPISSTSKVPYRVGLSRRARIAPLLKIVRK